MNKKISQAVALSKKVKHLIVATVDAWGIPHVAVAGELTINGDLIEVSSWYCPVTLVNIQEHPHISVVVWDGASDRGFQLIGKYERMQDVAMMDAFSPQTESVAVYPQVERKLMIRVERVLHFSQALHADTEEL